MTSEKHCEEWLKAGRERSDPHDEPPGHAKTARKGRAMLKLVTNDQGKFLTSSKITDALVAGFALLVGMAAQVKPKRQLSSEQARKAKAPATIVRSAYHRVGATRSVAAEKFGPEHVLTQQFGFKTTVKRDAKSLTAELEKQRRVIAQKDEHGKDLKDAAAHRRLLEEIGLGEEYATRMIQPEIEALRPYATATVEETPAESKDWQFAVAAACKQFYLAAELSFGPDRVRKYRAAQPTSQATRFAKIGRPKKKKVEGQAAPAPAVTPQPAPGAPAEPLAPMTNGVVAPATAKTA